MAAGQHTTRNVQLGSLCCQQLRMRFDLFLRRDSRIGEVVLPLTFRVHLSLRLNHSHGPRLSWTYVGCARATLWGRDKGARWEPYRACTGRGPSCFFPHISSPLQLGRR